MAHNLVAKERTLDVWNEDSEDFSSFQLPDHIVSGLSKAGYLKPSPIQSLAIPYGKVGLDLIVQSKSGTGKTLVYSIIALNMIDVSVSKTQCLILAPTREIAVQGSFTLESLSTLENLKISTFIGGLPITEDKNKVKCHIAVGTPGRIAQLIREKILSITSVRLFILDEADKLFESSFKQDVSFIADKLPSDKQILALSATYPSDIKLMESLMRRNAPMHVRLGQESQVLYGLKQFILRVPFHSHPSTQVDFKMKTLLQILETVTFNQCLVFFNYTLRAQAISESLALHHSWPSNLLAGTMSQSARLQSLQTLKNYSTRLLMTTDLAARGIDAENVDLVINFDIPKDHITYLHRIGRAGRYGTHGLALSLSANGLEYHSTLNIVEKSGSSATILETNSLISEINLWKDNLDDYETLNPRGKIEKFNLSDLEQRLNGSVNHYKLFEPRQISITSDEMEKLYKKNAVWTEKVERVMNDFNEYSLSEILEILESGDKIEKRKKAKEENKIIKSKTIFENWLLQVRQKSLEIHMEEYYNKLKEIQL